jgi:hypothetical protein
MIPKEIFTGKAPASQRPRKNLVAARPAKLVVTPCNVITNPKQNIIEGTQVNTLY